MLNLYFSNRLEALADALLDDLSAPIGPTAVETVSVSSHGMEVWLSALVADRYGIVSNIEFPFVRPAIDTLLERIFPAYDADAHFQAEAAVFPILECAHAHLADEAFAPVARYIEADTAGHRRVDFAERLAATFDAYLIYRPELIASWEAGESDDWQAIIWRSLPRRFHIARVWSELSKGNGTIANLPPRLSFFGLSALPPMYLDILNRLSAHTSIRLYCLNPCRAHWSDVRSRRELERLGHEQAESLFFEEGHPLLASLGLLGREFHRALDQYDFVEPEADLYRPAEPQTLLGAVQRGILDLDPAVRGPLDDSIRIFSCHSPLRELEILEAQLTSLFEADPALSPNDVIVLTPDVANYAPLIEAVFGESPIPYAIADRRPYDETHVLDAFDMLLSLAAMRLKRTAVIDVLSLEPVYRRLGLQAQDVERLAQLLEEVGVRWGIDGEHRARLGQPGFGENSWRFGLDRLFLGYATGASSLFGGARAFYPEQGAGVIAALADFVDLLDRCLVPGRQDSVHTWCERLLELLDGSISTEPEFIGGYRALRTALLALKEGACQYEEPVDLEVVRRILKSRLADTAASSGFMHAGITFCTMRPMRSIPFKVVCLLGMNDGAFPRTTVVPSFDLISQAPRSGDRTRREDDRYLFLEALLAARGRLLLSFVGQSIRDGSALPLSAVAEELVDQIAATTGEDRPAVENRLVERHPLQAFSPRYFTGGTLFSYSESIRAAAEALQHGPNPVAEFFRAPLEVSVPDQIDLPDLLRFFRSPPHYILERGLGITLGALESELDDREPETLAGLERYKVGEELLSAALAGSSASETIIRAEGLLTPGTPGEVQYGSVAAEVAPLAQAIGAYAQLPTEAVRIRTECDGRTVRGVVRGVGSPAEPVQPFEPVRPVWGFRRIRARHQMAAWVEHLALCANDRPVSTELFGRAGASCPKHVQWMPVAEAHEHLRTLVDVFVEGQRTPLPFFCDVALSYLERGADERALDRAREAILTADGQTVDLRLRGLFLEDPFSDGRFDALARRIFEPMLAHRQVLK